MSRIVRLPDSDYKVIVQNGGTITFDTTNNENDNTGEVVITGDLTVRGTTTTVESTVTTIADNIITLNEGQTGAGISQVLNYQAGIEVDRGSLSAGRWVFDDSIGWSQGGDSGQGLWKATNAADQLRPIRVTGIYNDQSIYFATGNGALSVTNTADYEENVFNYVAGTITDEGSGVILDDDNIPNARAVVDYVSFSLSSVFQARIEDGTTDKTFVEVKDDETTGNPSVIEVGIDGVVVTRTFENRTELHNIKIQDNHISTLNDDSTGEDLILSAGGNGSVRVDDTIVITDVRQQDDLLTPATNVPTHGTRVYGDTKAGGGTGLYFVNKDETNDELASRNRALLYGMLF